MEENKKCIPSKFCAGINVFKHVHKLSWFRAKQSTGSVVDTTLFPGTKKSQ